MERGRRRRRFVLHATILNPAKKNCKMLCGLQTWCVTYNQRVPHGGGGAAICELNDFWASCLCTLCWPQGTRGRLSWRSNAWHRIRWSYFSGFGWLPLNRSQLIPKETRRLISGRNVYFPPDGRRCRAYQMYQILYWLAMAWHLRWFYALHNRVIKKFDMDLSAQDTQGLQTGKYTGFPVLEDTA